MNIPMKYEDVVAKLDAALGREAALREELEKFRSGCVDLSSQVRELEHKMDYYKGEGLRADALQQRLIVAEQRVGELEELLRDCVNEFSTSEASQFELEMLNKILAELKPAAEPEHICEGCGSKGWTANFDQCIPY